MTESLVEGSDWLTWIESIGHSQSAAHVSIAPEPLRDTHRESWDNTDRPLRAVRPSRTATCADYGSSLHAISTQAARVHWLQVHDIHTEFLDGGIGCSWFAQQGDDEPVCGETEEAAIAKLARENGLPWYE